MDSVIETPVGVVNLCRMRVAEDLLEIAELLVEAFPSEERRPLWMYPPLLTRGDTRFYRVVHGGDTVGLLNLWDWGSLCYGEHMALRPELRGHGMGEAILREMVTSAERPFVLEVAISSVAASGSTSGWGFGWPSETTCSHPTGRAASGCRCGLCARRAMSRRWRRWWRESGSRCMGRGTAMAIAEKCPA